VTTLESGSDIKPGDLVYVAGEMYIFRESGNAEMSLHAFPQLGLVVSTTPTALMLWFAEFGINKEREHILACAPMNTLTTKVWGATSALAAPGAKDFLEI